MPQGGVTYINILGGKKMRTKAGLRFTKISNLFLEVSMNRWKNANCMRLMFPNNG